MQWPPSFWAQGTISLEGGFSVDWGGMVLHVVWIPCMRGWGFAHLHDLVLGGLWISGWGTPIVMSIIHIEQLLSQFANLLQFGLEFLKLA